MRIHVCLVLAAALTSGCATYAAYEGEKLPSSEVAIITGTAKIRTTLPLALVIRSVDGRDVGVQYASVSVAAGRHVLIVDCQVTGEFANTSRHTIEEEFEGGERYHLTATMAAGNRSCESVNLAAD